ncbi:MAG: hypothetical protein HQL48_05535 [Gammaproteobacteria bacterium]|nr:hypothetical protein [Gammaproteobacteria bacterium]
MWALLLLFAVGTGCHQAVMELDPQFSAKADQYAVSGRQGLMLKEKVSFGPYSSGEVDREWDSIGQWQLFGYHSATQDGGFRFQLEGGGGTPWRVECHNRATLREMSLDLLLGENWSWVVESNNRFSCGFTRSGESSERGWLMALAESGNGTPLGGMIGRSDGLRSWKIEGIDRLQGAAIATAAANGFTITGDHGALAAVEIINEGRVWIAKTVQGEDRDLLAAAALAMLLYREPERMVME